MITKEKLDGKGLLEVLVAISVFGIVCISLFGLLMQMTKLPMRQEESVRAEMLCRDISLYSDKHGRGWVTLFDESINADAQSGEILLGADLKPDALSPVYKLTYHYTDSGELIIGISHIESEREIVKAFNYGNERYT